MKHSGGVNKTLNCSYFTLKLKRLFNNITYFIELIEGNVHM